MTLSLSLRFAAEQHRIIEPLNLHHRLCKSTKTPLTKLIIDIRKIMITAKVASHLYLADNVGGQVKQAEGISFVPRVQHTKEVGNIISTVS